MFKKIYIEITNSCNFNCSFCYPSLRKKKTMSVGEFQTVVEKIKPFTQYVYLHLLGEPLLHPQFELILDIARANRLFVNLTTNGSLVKKHKELLKNKPVRQINISLHDWEENIEVANLEPLLINLFHLAEEIAPATYINFRLWNKTGNTINPFTKKCLAEISDYFGKDATGNTSKQNIRLAKNIFLQQADRFKWQYDKNDVEMRNAPTTCYALRDHIAILSDGSVVPCCIDADAHLLLGNIFTDDLNKILSTPKAKNIKDGFAQGTAVEEYCKNCGFR